MGIDHDQCLDVLTLKVEDIISGVLTFKNIVRSKIS